MSRRTDAPFLAAVLAGAMVTAAVAADLPPPDAPPHTAKYRMSSKSRQNPTDDWKFFEDDTITIAVAGKQSRWDYAKGGQTILNDQAAHVTTTFGGKIPPKKAYRAKAPFVPIGWEFGYGTVHAVDKNPERLGTATIAGRECTRLKFHAAEYGTPEYCVAKTGIVLRFANDSTTGETVYEAASVTDAAPAADRFVLPADLQVEERRRNRHVDIF